MLLRFMVHYLANSNYVHQSHGLLDNPLDSLFPLTLTLWNLWWFNLRNSLLNLQALKSSRVFFFCPFGIKNNNQKWSSWNLGQGQILSTLNKLPGIHSSAYFINNHCTILSQTNMYSHKCRTLTSEIPSDLVIQINDVTYLLHKVLRT
jgi:hypothetical protein